MASPQSAMDPEWRARILWPAVGLFEVGLPVGKGDRYWSPEIYDLIGIVPGDPAADCQRFLEELVLPEDRERVAAARITALREGSAMDVEFRIRRPDGIERRLQAVSRMTPADREGRRRLVGFVRDLTERRNAEDAAHEMRERILAVGRWSLLGELASGMAHELNQPLAAITTFAQAGARLLAQPAPDVVRARGILEDLAAQALRAGDVIRRMRSLIRSQAPEMELIDCNALVRDFLVLAEPIARASGVRVTLDLAPHLPTIRGDTAQLQQALMIFFRNAIDALQSASGRDREVGVATTLEGEAVCIAVLDNGDGVPASVARELFRPFFTTKRDGTGLGLAICRNIAGQHDGDLHFENRASGGARFWLNLPPGQGTARAD